MFADHTWWSWGRVFFYLINYSLALLYFVPTVIQIPDQTVARLAIFELYPQVRHFDTPEHEIFVVAYDMEVREYIGYRQLISLGVIIIQGLAFLIILHCNISMSTRNMTISKTTLKMQRMFLNAVYMQIAIPAIIMIVPQIILNVLGYLYMNSPEMNSLAYMFMSIHGASASVIMLYFHAPYQEFCAKLFCRRFHSKPKIEVNFLNSSGTEGITPL
ncbi:Serpentine Receptor, class H [Caenorhabditis elegans]|nr:Serpentine Receptor, class H [Caenorhabditis elegans]CCA65578.1 Serpentine Receptor, class H [Caenorhabditis elegans]|eukprot:NP_001256700.1 Serpentine Receptor, class H [Caenorhabditis elegans]